MTRIMTHEEIRAINDRIEAKCGPAVNVVWSSTEWKPNPMFSKLDAQCDDGTIDGITLGELKRMMKGRRK